MFPVSIAGGVRLEGHPDPDAAVRRLVAGLEDAEAEDVRVMGHGLTFRGGMRGSDAASLAVRNDGSATVVEYVLSFRHLLLGSSAAAAVLAGLFVLSNPEPEARLYAWFFAFAWLLVFGANVAIATVRFRSWLGKVTASDAPRRSLALETDSDESLSDPSASQIAELLEKLEGDDACAVLSRNSVDFIQTAGSPAEGFVLEYHDRASGLHRSIESRLPLDTITRAFQLYAAGNQAWRSLVTWEPAS